MRTSRSWKVETIEKPVINQEAVMPAPKKSFSFKRFFIKYLPFFTTPLAILALLGLWWWYILANPSSKYLLPPPDKVWERLIEWPSSKRLMADTWQTIYETLIGFAIGSVVGIVLGYLIAKSRTFERILNPFIIASQVIPKIALVPLFIFQFGFNSTPNIIIAVLLAFFPLLSNVVLGIKSVDESRHDLMNSLAANGWQRFRYVEFPYALPYILTGMEVAIVLALIGAVVGEYLNPNGGLGATAVQALNAFQLDRLFATIVVLTIIGFVFYAILVAARRIFIPWHESVRNTNTSSTL